MLSKNMRDNMSLEMMKIAVGIHHLLNFKIYEELHSFKVFIIKGINL